LFPLKIQIGTVKSRVLYLETDSTRKTWTELIKKASGFSDIKNFYDFGDPLGKGQFGLVFKAKHKKSGILAAIK